MMQVGSSGIGGDGLGESGALGVNAGDGEGVVGINVGVSVGEGEGV